MTTERIPKEAIGRQFLKIKLNEDFEELFKKVKNVNRELLLSFEIAEENLNLQSGKKIIEFLNKLKNNNIRVKVSKPLPRCILGMRYNEIVKEFLIPHDCYECSELFTVENEDIISCNYINKKGPKIYYMEDRNQIWEFFNILRLMNKPINECKKCRYFIRKQCDGLCFRRA